MILRGQLRFDKRNLPPLVFKFNVALICFFAAWFILCVPIMIVIGLIYDERVETYATMIALFAVFFIGLGIFYLVALRLRGRVVEENAARLEEEFADMPLDTAEEILKQKGVINDIGFVLKEDLFGTKTIPFDRAECSLFATLSASGVGVKAYVCDAGGEDGGSEIFLAADRALFNFLDKRNLINYKDDKELEYFKTDKRKFCRQFFGFRIK